MRSIYIFPASGLLIGGLVCWLAGLTMAQSLWCAVAMFGQFGLGVGAGLDGSAAELDEANHQLAVLRRQLSWYEQPAIDSYTALEGEEPTAGEKRYTFDTTAT